MMPQLDTRSAGATGQCIGSNAVERTLFEVAAPCPASCATVQVLTEADAIDLWLARWLKTPRKVILARYTCDARRIYEVWEGSRFPGSRAKALERLRALHPKLPEQTDVSRHRRIPRGSDAAQLSLFDR